MDFNHAFGSIERIENAPVPDGVFAYVGQLLHERFVAEVLNVGGQPFRLVKEPLCHTGIDVSEVREDGGTKRDSVPGHDGLPVETKLVGKFFAGQAFCTGKGVFQSCAQAFAELEPQIRVAQ